MFLANGFFLYKNKSLTAGKAENVSCLHVTKQNILF